MKKIDYKGLTIVIERDVLEYLEDPRTEDHLGVMVCFYRRLNLGDDYIRHGLKCEDFSGWDDLQKHIENKLEALCVMPLYFLDHSGISISTTPFNDSLDSGQIGFIFTTQERCRQILGTDKVSKERIKEKLLVEVDQYAAYLAGEVFQYRVITPWNEEIAGCAGFYGVEHEASGLLGEARGAIDSWLNESAELQSFSFRWTKVCEEAGLSSVTAHNKLEAYQKALDLLPELTGIQHDCPEQNEILFEGA